MESATGFEYVGSSIYLVNLVACILVEACPHFDTSANSVGITDIVILSVLYKVGPSDRHKGKVFGVC